MAAPPPHRPFGIRAFNTAGRGLAWVGLKLPDLGEERFIAAAKKKTGLSDFGGEGFREGMHRLLASIDKEAELSTIGRLMAKETISGYLENRLRIQEHRKRHPEVDAEQVRRPIVIAGIPRTGTTILFNLLAQDPAIRAPLSWEVEKPYPPPETATYTTDPRIAEAQKRFDGLDKLAPDLAAIHEFAADLPQECVAITAHEFMSVQFHIIYKVPEYQAWLDQQSYIPALQFHRRFLQHLQSRCPGERWVLKTPGHLSVFEDLLEVYPDACVIHTHRDPIAILPSLASLSYNLRCIGSDHVDPFYVGRDQTDLWAQHLQRAIRARDKLVEKRSQFFDTQFEDVLKDPIGLIGKIYDHFEIEFTPTARLAMETFLAANPRGSRGAHKPTLEDFGLDAARDGALFEEYRNRFDIPSSRTR